MARTLKPETIRKRMEWQFRKWTVQTCKNKTAKDLQKAIRMESAGDDGFCHCCSCGRRVHWKACHAGHFVGGRKNSVLFEENGIHPQCPHCNKDLGGNPSGYREFMLRAYGPAETRRIELLRFKDVTFTKWELLDMRLEYRDRIRAQEERLG